MTPGQARFAFASFVMVGVGVVANALLLQSRPAMTARAAERAATIRPVTESGLVAATPDAVAKPPASTTTASLRTARHTSDSAKASPASAPDAEREAVPETVRAIQRELRLRGYGALPSDGAPGLATRAAIMAYEHDQGLVPSGRASERILRHILFGIAAGEAKADEGRATTAQAEQVVRTVQQSLAALGYRPGPADGTLNAATAKAIREFEVDKGLVPRGRISADLVTRLAEAAAPKAERQAPGSTAKAGKVR